MLKNRLSHLYALAVSIYGTSLSVPLTDWMLSHLQSFATRRRSGARNAIGGI